MESGIHNVESRILICGALTVCMEKPEIPGENSNGTVHTFRGITFYPFLPKRPKFSYHLFGLPVPGFMSKESEKFTGIL